MKRLEIFDAIDKIKESPCMTKTEKIQVLAQVVVHSTNNKIIEYALKSEKELCGKK